MYNWRYLGVNWDETCLSANCQVDPPCLSHKTSLTLGLEPSDFAESKNCQKKNSNQVKPGQTNIFTTKKDPTPETEARKGTPPS